MVRKSVDVTVLLLTKSLSSTGDCRFFVKTLESILVQEVLYRKGYSGPGLFTLMCSWGFHARENRMPREQEWLGTTYFCHEDEFCFVLFVRSAAWRMSHIFFFSCGLHHPFVLSISDMLQCRQEACSMRRGRVMAYNRILYCRTNYVFY